MTPERTDKFRKVVARRQPDLTVILENVHDPHNIGAVLRTCDSVGIKEIFVLYTDPQLRKDRLSLSKRTSAGARKWVDVHYYTNAASCFEHIKRTYQSIWSTCLAEDAVTLHQLDLTTSVALLFGNEHEGVSEEAQAFSEGNFIIPQVGMVESLNISVACAVTLYEAFRQRKERGFYGQHPLMKEVEQEVLFREYERRHNQREDRKSVPRSDCKEKF
jgi:tRNA (guanosine-2'-O-)-methyltransferase